MYRRDRALTIGPWANASRTLVQWSVLCTAGRLCGTLSWPYSGGVMVWVYCSRRCHYGYWTQAAHEFIDASARGSGIGLAGGRVLWRAHGTAPGSRESLHFAAPDASAPLYHPVANHGAWAVELP